MGAPEGNQYARKAKLFEGAIKRALARHSGTVDGGLDKLADVLVSDAIDKGDPFARREIADRIDGKPHQSVAVSGDEDAPLVTRVELVPLSAKRTG